MTIQHCENPFRSAGMAIQHCKIPFRNAGFPIQHCETQFRSCETATQTCGTNRRGCEIVFRRCGTRRRDVREDLRSVPMESALKNRSSRRQEALFSWMFEPHHLGCYELLHEPPEARRSFPVSAERVHGLQTGRFPRSRGSASARVRPRPPEGGTLATQAGALPSRMDIRQKPSVSTLGEAGARGGESREGRQKGRAQLAQLCRPGRDS